MDFSWFTKSNKEVGESEIPSIFNLSIAPELFIRSDIINTYVKILTDVAERTHGIPEGSEPLLWDSCEQSESTHGLISLLAHAMFFQTDLFLVLAKTVKVLRKATSEEEAKIRADYKAHGKSSVGVYISFKLYRRTEMLQIYSSFEYCVLASLNKTLNISKSVQFKINDLRASVSFNDSAIARAQAQSIAKAMKNGNDVLLDAKDMVTTAAPDTGPTEKAISFLDAKRAFILGLPLSYIVGEQTGGLNATGEADMRAVERGLRQYFVSIIRPVLNAIFNVSVEFKSQDFRQITSALEVLKTFDLTSNDNLSSESKQNIVARVFDLDPDEEKKQIEADAKEAAKNAKANPPPAPVVDPNAPPVPAPAQNPPVKAGQ